MGHVFIKGAALAAEELTPTQLEALQKGDTVTLGITPDGETKMIIVQVHILATHVRKLLVRIEGYTYHNKKRANVIAQLFTAPDKLGDGYAELTFYS